MTSTATAAIAFDAPVAAPRPLSALAAPRHSFLLGWTLAWLAVGVVVAAGISIGAGIAFFPVLRLSVLFAEVVGFSAYTSVRLVSPLLARLHGALRLTLDSLIVLAGTIFGSIAVLLTDPFFAVAQYRYVLLILGVNALLAVGVAVALGTYDRMRRQIEASYRVLRQRDALERGDERRPRGPARAAAALRARLRGAGAGRRLPPRGRRGRRLLRLPAVRGRPSGTRDRRRLRQGRPGRPPHGEPAGLGSQPVPPPWPIRGSSRPA